MDGRQSERDAIVYAADKFGWTDFQATATILTGEQLNKL
jgi:hypothetical protein